jgi:hypothetical protein
LLLTANQILHIFVPKWGEVRKALFKLKVTISDFCEKGSVKRVNHIGFSRQRIFKGINIQNRYAAARNLWIRVRTQILIAEVRNNRLLYCGNLRQEILKLVPLHKHYRVKTGGETTVKPNAFLPAGIRRY